MPNPSLHQTQKNTYKLPITWVQDATSVTFDLGGAKLSGIVFPSGMTNTSVDVEISYDNGATYNKIYSNFGTKLSAVVNQGFVTIAPIDVVALEGNMRLVGSAETGSNKALIVISRPL
jgi:hypothetical protein